MTTAIEACFQGNRAAVIVSLSDVLRYSRPEYHMKVWF